MASLSRDQPHPAACRWLTLGPNGAFPMILKPLRADGADLFPVRAALWRIYCPIGPEGVRMRDSGQHVCLGR